MIAISTIPSITAANDSMVEISRTTGSFLDDVNSAGDFGGIRLVIRNGSEPD